MSAFDQSTIRCGFVLGRAELEWVSLQGQRFYFANIFKCKGKCKQSHYRPGVTQRVTRI